jgi:hypothetical protein
LTEGGKEVVSNRKYKTEIEYAFVTMMYTRQSCGCSKTIVSQSAWDEFR